VLPKIESNSIDFVLTDPPYPLIDWPYGSWTVDEWTALMGNVVGECQRILKPTGRAIFLFHPKHLPQETNWLKQFSWNLPYRNNICILDTHDFQSSCENILERVPKGGTVLDPFCGGGSIVMAALMNQLNVIGIEKSANYYQQAEKRFESFPDVPDEEVIAAIRAVPIHFGAPPSGDWQLTFTDVTGSTYVKTGTFTGSQIDNIDLFSLAPASHSIRWPIKGIQLEVRTTAAAPAINYRVTGGFVTGA